MKSVLISIQPKWVEKICHEIGNENGKPIYEKTIEVRKTRPKIETPFKCYIYCTMGKIPKFIYNEKLEKESVYKRYPDIQNGRVIGEFVCDMIYEFHEWQLTPSNEFYKVEQENLDLFLKESCLTYEEVCKYREYLPYFKPLYCWHISNLKIYDKPKELSEFWYIDCKNKKNGCVGCEVKPSCIKIITRPPQSWCKVESF